MALLQRCLLSLGVASIIFARGLASFTCDGGATILEENRVREEVVDVRFQAEHSRP